MGATLALLAALDTACTNVDQLGEACAAAFVQHPTTRSSPAFRVSVTSLAAACWPKLVATVTASSDARAMNAYAGSAPVTRASGRSISITHRRIDNDRLAAAGFIWAFIATKNSTGARAHYDRRRQPPAASRQDHGDRHAAALRNLANRFLGCLYQCLTTGQTYSETKAFPTPIEVTGLTAAGDRGLTDDSSGRSAAAAAAAAAALEPAFDSLATILGRPCCGRCS